MLETQISQVAQQQAPTAAPADTFPGQPQPNPKGHAHAIILRSGTELDGPPDPRLSNQSMYQRYETPTEKENQPEKPEEDEEDKGGEAKEKEKEKPYVPPPPYKPQIPFPGRLAKPKNVG